MSCTSLGSNATSHAHRPKPPVVLIALTHSSRAARLALFRELSVPLISSARTVSLYIAFGSAVIVRSPDPNNGTAAPLAAAQ